MNGPDVDSSQKSTVSDPALTMNDTSAPSTQDEEITDVAQNLLWSDDKEFWDQFCKSIGFDMNAPSEEALINHFLDIARASECIPVFRNHKIDLLKFSFLTDDDLISMGVHDSAVRLRVMNNRMFVNTFVPKYPKVNEDYAVSIFMTHCTHLPRLWREVLGLYIGLRCGDVNTNSALFLKPAAKALKETTELYRNDLIRLHESVRTNTKKKVVKERLFVLLWLATKAVFYVFVHS